MTKALANEIRETVRTQGWQGVRNNPRLNAAWKASVAASRKYVESIDC